MPSGPSGRAPRGEDDPEFNWLYGGQGDAQGAGPNPPPSDDPDPTRMMPVQPRPEPRASAAPGGEPPRAARTSTRPAVPPPRPVPADPTRPARPTGPNRRGRTAGRVVLAVVLVWVLFLVAVPVWAWQKIDRVDIQPAADVVADQPGTTYLLVGSDSRKGLSAEERKKLGTGNAAGQRTDTIMLLHVGSGPNLLLSIPRDSIVAIPGHGTTKINAAFAFGGPKLLVRTIEKNTGVHIDDFVEIGMGGVVNSVDAVGGVRVCAKKKLVDKLANLNMTKGCHQVDGITALAFSRTRHTQALGDIDRAKNQRAIVSQVGSKVKSPWTVLNPFRYYGIASAGASSLRISKGMSPFALGRFAVAMTRVNGTDGLTCSMPIRDLAVHWDDARKNALMKLISEDRTSDVSKTKNLCTATGLPNR